MYEFLPQTSLKLPHQDLPSAVVNTYNGHIYTRFEEVITWEKAEAFCEKEGGHLAIVSSRGEQLAIAQMFSDVPYGEEYGFILKLDLSKKIGGQTMS